MTTTTNPQQLFFDQLRGLYSGEVQLCESMPHLVSLCTNEDLCDLLVKHGYRNCDQIEEIAAIFERHGESPGEDKCLAMAGLIEGGVARLEGQWSPHTRDRMMIAHCLRIESHLVAAFENTTLFCGRLGLMREPAILAELMAEEKEMATALMQLEQDLCETANCK